MSADIATIIAKETVTGIPVLWEWGALVTFLFITNVASLSFGFLLYKNNQALVREVLDLQHKTVNSNNQMAKMLEMVVTMFKGQGDK